MIMDWGLSALVALATLSSARSVCDDITQYIDIPETLDGDTTITLDVTTIECEAPDYNTERETVVIQGGTLTLVSTETVRFINMGFTVEDGASLVFDMPKTRFGPAERDSVEDADGYLLDVKEGGSATFLGKFVGKGVENAYSMFSNEGTIEFKKVATFQDNGNVFRTNSGTLKFRKSATFKDNSYLAIENVDSGFVRFSTTATFDNNGDGFDGGDGCAISNTDLDGTVIFRGDATFDNHNCDLAGAVSNTGTMRFYGKAYFNDNKASEYEEGNGGGFRNKMGSTIFKGAVQFNNNEATEFGGGLAVEGGDVTFEKAVLFDGNDAQFSGGAFSVTYGQEFKLGELVASGYGTLTFEKPSVVRYSDNTVSRTDIDTSLAACTVGYVEDGSTAIGFPDDDVCVDKFA